MPEEVKFTEEELKDVTEIQNSYLSIQNNLGQLSVAKIRLQDDVDRLNEAENNLKGEFKKLQDKEKSFLDGITKKYGQGSLNPETGVFTPTESENKSE